GFGRFANERAQSFAVVAHASDVESVDERVVSSRPDLLAEKDRDPVRVDEELVVFAEESSGCPEKIDLALQGARNAHRAAIIPEWRIVAAGRMVVQHDEVADALPRERRESVVLRDLRLIETPRREERQELGDAGLDEMNAR